MIKPIEKEEQKPLNLIKIFFRVLHQLSACVLGGLVIYNYLSNNELAKKMKKNANHSRFNSFLGILLFATGITNIFLIKNEKDLSKNEIHKLWQHFFELKFVLSLFLTPLIYPLTMLFAEDGKYI